MRVTAAEAFSDGLRMTAKRATGVELIQTDALHLPYDAEFDVVGAFDVIEHIADDGVAVREMVRAVRPDGGLIFTVPQHRFLWSPFDDYVHHHRRYSRPEMRRLLESAGCDVVFVTSFVSLLLPAMFLARMVRRVVGVSRLRLDESTRPLAAHNGTMAHWPWHDVPCRRVAACGCAKAQ
jgi:SAM-dependent methyltransferase